MPGPPEEAFPCSYPPLLVTFLVVQMVKFLPTMREAGVQSLGQEDPLEKEMATHSSILAWKIPLTEEPGRLQPMGLQSRTQLSDFTSLHPPLLVESVALFASCHYFPFVPQ